jgi:hypothetical protein
LDGFLIYYYQKHTMSSRFIIIILFSLIIFPAMAQFKVPASYGNSIAIGVDVGSALGPVTQYYKASGGLVAKGEFHLTQAFNLTASAGFQSFLANSTYAYRLRDNHLPNPPFNLIPLKVGARYYLDDEWYAEGESGAVLYTIDYKHPAITTGIGTGFSFQMDGNRAFDIGIRIENLSRKDFPNQMNFEHIAAIRFAYKFGL